MQLFLNCRHAAAFVVVSWANDGVTWEGEDLTVDAVIQATSTALLKVRSATATDKQRIPGENEPGSSASQLVQLTTTISLRCNVAGLSTFLSIR